MNSARLQFFAARFLGYLPERVLRALCGEPPLTADGIAFDAHAQLLRRVRRRRHRYGLIEPNVDAGRKRYRFETRAFRGPVTPVGEVRDLQAGSLRVRHYRPSRASRDLLVYLHGGGFAIGDLDTHDEPCRMLCAHAQTEVLSVEYRLAPEHPFPAALEDTLTALAWAQETFRDARISIGGDSAGANLATVAAQLASQKPHAQLLIYPVTDSHNDRRSYELFGEGHFLTMIDREGFRACYLDGTGVPADDPRVSPLHFSELRAQSPALVVTAGFDLLRDEGEAYADALAAAGVLVKRRRVETLGHGFVHLTGINRTARKAMLDIARDWRDLLTSIRP